MIADTFKGSSGGPFHLCPVDGLSFFLLSPRPEEEDNSFQIKTNSSRSFIGFVTSGASSVSDLTKSVLKSGLSKFLLTEPLVQEVQVNDARV